MVKKILLGLLLCFVAIQFFRPEKNESQGLGDADISLVYSIPEDVHLTLQSKCYDCHSNNTVYPWYYNLQPIAWWMNDHIIDGKKHLNFSDYKNYPEKRATHKLEETLEMIDKKEMPLKSYLIAHPSAEITDEENKAIHAWIESLGVLDKEGE